LAIQEHIFDRDHLDNVRVAIEQGRYEPPSPGEALNQAIAALQPPGSTEGQRFASSPQPPVSGSSSTGNPQLQMFQMAAQGMMHLPPPEGAIPVDPQSGGSGSGPHTSSSNESEHREKMEKALMQLYGMGHGIIPR
jgi:hypothetical protein